VLPVSSQQVILRKTTTNTISVYIDGKGKYNTKESRTITPIFSRNKGKIEITQTPSKRQR